MTMTIKAKAGEYQNAVAELTAKSRRQRRASKDRLGSPSGERPSATSWISIDIDKL